ncbi:DUF3556 domain-containing protein [Mycolicibacter minnesotensis]
MSFTKPNLPADVDPATWTSIPRWQRLQTMTRHWTDNGFGTPYAVYLLYVLKIAAYLGGAAAVISLTPGLGSLTELSSWWTQPIVYQKLVVFSLLFEVLGLGCGSGPLTLRFVPPLGGFLYWLRPGTIRLPPWPDKVPLTRGDTRTPGDVALYAVLLISLGWALLAPGTGGPVTARGDVGLLDPVLVIPALAALLLLGMRDKTVFLAARAEHYGLALIVFFFPLVDQIAAFKLILLALWWGAATSKLNHHFPYVMAVMMSNNPMLIPAKWAKRLMWRDPVNDLRPSRLPQLLAHVGGTTSEFVIPLYLVFFAPSHGPWLWAALIYMVLFHLTITSTIPMGVPLEWNAFFMVSLFYLYGGYGDYRVTDIGSPLLLAILGVFLVLVPIVGNMFPDKVSFLPSMRYYAGNWAASAWCLRPGVEDKIEANVTKCSSLANRQLAKLYGPQVAEVMLDKMLAWRAMHTHGRALNGLVPRAVDDECDYVIRDGEYMAGPLIGWNFGEGHLHNEQLIDALQRRCDFADGDVRVVLLEGQPIHRHWQAYRIVDAKTGVIERGFVQVADMIARQPWPEPGDQFPVRLRSLRRKAAVQ